MRLYLQYIVLFCLSFVFSHNAISQDTIILKKGFEKYIIRELNSVFAPERPFEFRPNDLIKAEFGNTDPINGDSILFFKLYIKNTINDYPLDISFFFKDSEDIALYYRNKYDDIQTAKGINIRGMNMLGKIPVETNETKTIYIGFHNKGEDISTIIQQLKITVLDYKSFLHDELSSRFRHSVLLGLLLFSAFLNLILGLIIKRRSFIILFFYLLCLFVFSFSYLGFYDEFTFQKLVNIPIAIPMQFMTLVFFLFLSKIYLRLKKNLPNWDTITNVLILFLVISVPYYYLAVFFEQFYNDFLVFSSIFFLAMAAFMGVIESVIIYTKESRAKYFLVANLVVVISLGISVYLHNQIYVVEGSVLQGFIFTIGLAEEIKKLGQDKILFQQNYIKQLELNLNLKDSLNTSLGKKVEARTHELNHANKQLVKQNKLVEEQKELLELKNKKINASITYAKRIQNASFPDRTILERACHEYFILNQPKDIVSGDFYWFGEVGNKTIIIAADSTGHGVPGAFMSMFGIAFLNEIVNKQKIWLPNEILNTLREKIISSLSRNEDEFETMDGMDMAIITLDKQKGKLYFSGANHSLYSPEGSSINSIKGDRMPVAYMHHMQEFRLHELNYIEGGRYYIFTDGYSDQFGGPEGKKFGIKRLKNLLTSSAQLDMKAQKEQLKQILEEWKGEYSQIDDILMIGFSL